MRKTPYITAPLISLDDPRILSTAEAAEMWGVTTGRIRQKQLEGGFPPGTIRKFGKQWVVLVDGMYAAFGQPKNDDFERERANMHMNWNWELYEKIAKMFDLDVQLSEVKASSEEELLKKFKAWAKEWERDDLLEELEEDGEVQINFIGPGYYDLWGYDHGSGAIIRIDKILDDVVENIEVFTNPDKVKMELMREYDALYIYAVYGVTTVGLPEYDLCYVVSSKKKLSDAEVYDVLEQNGVEPHAYGLGGFNEFANYTILELDEMDSEELHELVRYIDDVEYYTANEQ